MIGIIIFSIFLYLIVVCPLIGHFFMNVLGWSPYRHSTIKEYFTDHDFGSFWVGVGFEWSNMAAGILATLIIAIPVFAIVLIIIGV